MKNLVFRSCLVVTVCWQLAATERSANGYFYDKPEGISFEETPGSVQLLAAPQPHQQAPVTVTTTLQQLQPPPLSYAGGSNLEIIPATLVYEDTKTIDSALRPPQQVVQDYLRPPQQVVQDYLRPPQQVVQDNLVNFVQPQQDYRTNLQPVAFTVKEANGVPQPCGVQPIVAQVNPALVNLSGGGPLTRIITTCGPNNNCNSITVQADLNRHLGVQAIQGQQYGAPAPQESYGAPEGKSAYVLVRPPNRRLVEYSEIESNDPYN